MAAGAVPDATYGGDQDNTSAWFTFWFQLIWFTMVYYEFTMVYVCDNTGIILGD